MRKEDTKNYRIRFVSIFPIRKLRLQQSSIGIIHISFDMLFQMKYINCVVDHDFAGHIFLLKNFM